VNRDELEDGGAGIFAETIRLARDARPGITVEVLIPDFRGDEQALRILVGAKPDILNHNTETVPRLYPTVRPQAKYTRSLELLERGKEWGMVTKSGLMLGLGETTEEIVPPALARAPSGAPVCAPGRVRNAQRARKFNGFSACRVGPAGQELLSRRHAHFLTRILTFVGLLRTF
jgi:lipoic acid synthetase